MASWAKYLTSMSWSAANFSNTGFTSVCRELAKDKSRVFKRGLVWSFPKREHKRNVQEDVLAVQNRTDLLQRLGHVEAHISHLIVGHFQDDGEHVLGGDLLTARL